MDEIAQRPSLALGGRASADAAGRRDSAVSQKRAEVTVHQLRIFWAIAHSNTLTKAAKQLGLAQPSLSQQLSKLEQTIGTLLFQRRAGEMTLTEAGNYLLSRAEHVLRGIRELKDGLSQYSDGKRVTVRLAGINSVLRVILLPQAIHELQAAYPDADFDIQESAPADVLEMLHGRRINVGLLAANSVAEDAVVFVQVTVAEEPYVLVVPEASSLDGIEDPERELSEPDHALINRSIQFIFGTRHADRVRRDAARSPHHSAVPRLRAGAGPRPRRGRNLPCSGSFYSDGRGSARRHQALSRQRPDATDRRSRALAIPSAGTIFHVARPCSGLDLRSFCRRSCRPHRSWIGPLSPISNQTHPVL